MTDNLTNFSESSCGRIAAFLRVATGAAAVWSVLTIGLHLWPFEGKHTLEVLAPINLGILLWMPMAMVALRSRTRGLIVAHLPDVSVWAFLAVAAASVSFAPHLGQSAASLAKFALMYVGAFTLFRLTCNRQGWADRLCLAAMAAACLAMLVSGTSSLSGTGSLGFFANAFKYGTVTAILFTLGSVYLASRRSPWAWLVVPATALAAATMANLGGLFGIVAGFAAGLLTARRPQTRWRLAAGLVVMAAVLVAGWSSPMLSRLRSDVQLSEPNGVDLRQRYIEWHANLNLLERRSIAGTGLGCVNEYRSMFYGRLPKLNSLQPFDRNGWLLTAAETGVFGLAAFVWMIARAGRAAWHATKRSGPEAEVAAVALAGLVSACAVNTFSSVNYNGVLNAFVLVLALAHHSSRMGLPNEQRLQGDMETPTPTGSIRPLTESRVHNG